VFLRFSPRLRVKKNHGVTLKILSIDNNSTGVEAGFQIGDVVLRINSHPVRDILDYKFLITDEEVEMEVRRNGDALIFEIEKDADDSLGLNFAPIQVRRCGNDCPFCFVDQNPAGMRKALYFRDEDYRLSFLSGHYVTLTNLKQDELDRIVWQRLTPLYVSVHATDPAVRHFLLGLKKEDHLLDKLRFLTGNGIELHTQIVLCPGINDGEILRNTLYDLAEFYPQLRSVSIVPVGLTKHRDGLLRLEPVTVDYAKRFLKIADDYADFFRKRFDTYFVYPSDEFYIMTGAPLPSADRYDAFYQKENGVGMMRALLDDFAKRQTPQLPSRLPEPTKVTLVSAVLAGGIIQNEIMPMLNRVENFTAELVIVKNEFYGESIHVTGLLTGQDIYNALKDRDLGSAVFLPRNCVNDKLVFLDDWKLSEMEKKLGVPVVALENEFGSIFERSEV
jgi:putative radical SAM enzyme (TIGR03279 family)